MCAREIGLVTIACKTSAAGSAPGDDIVCESYKAFARKKAKEVYENLFLMLLHFGRHKAPSKLAINKSIKLQKEGCIYCWYFSNI